jgi:SsrA-binding protein
MGRAKKQLSKKAEAQKKETPSFLNRKAHHDFEILDTLQAGLILVGTEVKSLRLGRAQLNEGFVRIDKNGEVFLYGVTIPQYEFGNRYNHDPTRIRKLLLNSKEILKWKMRVDREKLTIVPLKIYFNRGWVKVLIGLAKRKLLHDKRKQLKNEAIDMETKKAIKNSTKY